MARLVVTRTVIFDFRTFRNVFERLDKGHLKTMDLMTTNLRLGMF